MEPSRPFFGLVYLLGVFSHVHVVLIVRFGTMTKTRMSRESRESKTVAGGRVRETNVHNVILINGNGRI